MQLHELEWKPDPRPDTEDGYGFEVAEIPLADGCFVSVWRPARLNTEYEGIAIFVECRTWSTTPWLGAPKHSNGWQNLDPITAQAILHHLLAELTHSSSGSELNTPEVTS